MWIEGVLLAEAAGMCGVNIISSEMWHTEKLRFRACSLCHSSPGIPGVSRSLNHVAWCPKLSWWGLVPVLEMSIC